MTRRSGLAASLLAILLLAAAPARAQAPAAAQPAPVSAAELQRLVDTLQNDQQRGQLVEQLRALIATERGREAEAETPASLLGQIEGRIDAISGEVVAAAAVVVDLPRLFSWLAEQVRDPDSRGFWLEVGLRLLVIFGFALGAEWGTRRLLARWRLSLAGIRGERLPIRLALMLTRAVVDALPVLAFAGIAYLILNLPVTGTRYATAKVAMTLIGAYVTRCLVVAAARVILLPRFTTPLFHRMSEESRGYLYLWIKRFANWLVYGYAVAASTWWLGVPGSIYSLLLKGAGLVLATLGVIFVLQNRAAVADWLRGRPPAGEPGSSDRDGWRLLRDRLADVWHVLAILYIVGIYLVYALRIEGGFLFVARATAISIAVLVAARVVVNLVRRGARRGFAIGPDLKARFPTLEQRANRYLPILTAVIAAVAYAFAALAVLQAWDFESFSWFGSNFGRRLTGTVISIGTVVLIALVLWEIFSSAIERYLAAVDVSGNPVARSARARTLLPLLRTSMLVVIVVLVSMIVLSELGVDIGPLLAGAGVVGIAIGFGSQALVKDVITGLFILVEDTIAVGDVVDVGKGHAGTVEAISIRTIRLRDGAGTLHAVPFSEVTSVNNLTRDYAYFVANIALSYREDLDRVASVLEEIGAELMRDAGFRPFILDRLEVIGVDKMSELGIVLQIRIKTLPRQQWAVGHEFYRRMKPAFDRHGIELPYAIKPGYLADLAKAEPSLPKAKTA